MADYGVRTYRLREALLSRALLDGMQQEGDALLAHIDFNGSQSAILPALDSATPDHVWGRLALEADLGPEAILSVRCFATDQKLAVYQDEVVDLEAFLLNPEIPNQEKEKLFLLQGGLEQSGTQDILLTSQHGRYLWLWLVIAGEGDHALRNMRIYVPGEQFFRTFPQVYREENPFLQRYLAIFSTLFQDFQEKINALPELLDADTAPDELLPVFTSWLGLEIDEALFTPDEVRLLLKAAPELMARKGTKWAIETVLRLFISEKVYVVERNMLQEDQLHSERIYGTTPYDFSVMIDRRLDEKTRLRVQFLIEQFKPIRSRYRIVFLEDCGGLDGFTYLDINGSVLENGPGSLDDGQALTGMTYLQ